MKKASIVDLVPLTQIAYVPYHAMKNGVPIDGHSDVEYSFVTSIRGRAVFARHMRSDGTNLRTKINNESADINNIWLSNRYPTKYLLELALKYNVFDDANIVLQ